MTSISKNPTIMLYGMAHAVVIYVYGQVHMRSDRGLPTNITTVLFENLHWDCRLSAFFMPVFHFMPLFCIYQVIFAGGSKKNYSIMSDRRDFISVARAISCSVQYSCNFSYCKFDSLIVIVFVLFLFHSFEYFLLYS